MPSLLRERSLDPQDLHSLGISPTPSRRREIPDEGTSLVTIQEGIQKRRDELSHVHASKDEHGITEKPMA